MLAPRVEKFLRYGLFAYLLGLVFSAIVLMLPMPAFLSPMVFLLEYGPRRLLVLPLLAAMFLLNRRARLLYLVAGIVYLVVVSGLTISANGLRNAWSTFRTDQAVALPRRETLRLATYNIGNGDVTPADLLALFRFENLDVLAIQEGYGGFGGRIAKVMPDDIRTVCAGELCLLSKWPTVEVDHMLRAPVGGYGNIAASFSLLYEQQQIDIIVVHLDRPRPLEHIYGTFEYLVGVLDQARYKREQESIMALQLMPESTDRLIVMGDFNATQQGDLYRTYWSHLNNAFSESGLGWGNTVSVKGLGTRVDHVLLGSGLKAVSARVEPGLGGDHKPLVVDIVLR
jgi:endonuclease/exonuclease/phosphatase (EEP) superfamily protein YafD